ncbi:hypothetical protein Tco_0066571 [Tanacetum coccineum]
MHNNIMAAGSKDRPPMLGPGRYSQWHSRFLRYLDTKSNGEYLRKCIFEGPYMPFLSRSRDVHRRTRSFPKLGSPEKGNEDLMQKTEDKVIRVSIDASFGLIQKAVGQQSKEQDTSSRSGNDAHADDADLRPIYNEEPMAEVDLNAEQCHDTCPLPAKLTDNQTTELSNQSLEFENICLKKTVAQFQKDFLRMKAHCINLELKYQNKALKERKHGQFSKVKSKEAKIKHDIDVIETINIELEHKVAKLLKENETLKRHYKELFDSIKTMRTKTIEHTTSLLAQNDEFKAQL